METIADHVIDALGGTTAVARLSATAPSTVHSWRKNGIPPSRLAHLKLAAAASGIGVNIDAVIAANDGLQPNASVALCGRCGVRAEAPSVASCTSVHCPMRAVEQREREAA